MEYAQYPQQQNAQHAIQTSPIIGSQQPPGAQPPQGHNMYQPQYGVPQQGMQQVPYGMPGIQAAAMAATAAASGTNYPYMHSDPSMSQTSPRMGSKKENHQSPRMGNMGHMPDRRMSQVASPQGPMMNHRQGVAPPQMPAAQMQHPQSPEMAPPVEESPLYVNAKQFHRILKRRVARQRLDEQLRLTSKGRKPYLHESRHNHAMRRPRGPGGRFLTADEVAAMEKDKDKEDIGDAKIDDGASTGSKRKSETDPSTSSKRAKTEEENPTGEEEG
ncbi:hypothetical protein GMORB2_6185 [Geosmithia morbida]|uniref:Transcriptional activator HAP2 n=1 Tax=Geosmithia morbida TaxID=1094350 RepID=A0A9P5D6G5_9HYPO|nr:uncharacterized protein GMORB2_6185 [Geosmithia morbida]KAF4123484.1 hypothetical protein GMORB2_6185 [Geosmithia morbida]